MGPEQPEYPEAIRGFSADGVADDPPGRTPGDPPRSAPGHPPEPTPGGAPDHAARARRGDELLGRTLALVRHLRTHCPWDAEQTPRSLRPYLLEEAHETADAVLAGDDEELAGELGDLLLNVAFQVVLAEEREAFDGPEVVRRLEAKMRDRHPHVYGDAEEAPDWEELKAGERSEAGRRSEGEGEEGAAPSPLAGIPDELEPLSRSLRVQQRAAAVGFDWEDASGALDKLVEEAGELRRAASGTRDEAAATGQGAEPPDGTATEEGAGPAGSEAARASRHPLPGGTVPDPAVEEEVGDLLFAAVNVARLGGVHPAGALARATRKFEERFAALARLARRRSLDLDEASLEEMEALWREVKAGEAEEA